MIRNIINKGRSIYGINILDGVPLTSKTYKVKCTDGKCYFAKKTDFYTQEKYSFLAEQGINNILFPIRNIKGNYISKSNDDFYFLMDFYKTNVHFNEFDANHLHQQLSTIHKNSSFKRQLSVEFSRKKMEDIYEYLQYKFSVIEIFIRSIESRTFDEYSIVILKNYRYILQGKRVISKLHKRIISDIKERKSIEHAFIHNNPKINHLINMNGMHYLTSIERSKIGISSLDIAKYYLEVEDFNIDSKSIILNYFNNYNDSFYFDYFCFIVLFYYIKGIIIIDKDYITSQSFIFTSGSIKRFIEKFELDESIVKLNEKEN